MEEKYKSDLQEIKDMMIRSSRFISLSGTSGIAVGIIALMGAYLANRYVYQSIEEMDYTPITLPDNSLGTLMTVAIATLITAIIAAIVVTTRESRKTKQAIWDVQTKRLVINLSIPLISGGLLCLIFLNKGFIALLPPLTLVFHGLALVNASQYTLKTIRTLGILILITGLIAFYFVEYGLILWAFGFGVLHILYGIIMFSKSRS